MTENIKKAVSEFKKTNGNHDYTQKELIMYIIKRIDDLPCIEHVSRIQDNDTRGKILLWINGVEITMIISLILLIINIG
jgi:hypothetical protein